MEAITGIASVVRILRNLAKAPITFWRNGFAHSLHLIYVCYVLPLAMRALPLCVKLYVRAKSVAEKYYFVDREISHLRLKREELLSRRKAGYRTTVADLGLGQDQLALIRKNQLLSRDVVIAEVDQDGFLLSHFGPIKDAPSVSENRFLRRKRFALEVVAANGYLAVRKHYRGDKLSFVNEVRALHRLGLAGCRVPALLDVDFDNLTLTFSYIAGRVLREELAKRGAVLRDRDVENNPQYTCLNPRERWLKCIRQGRQVLYDVIDSRFVESLFAQLQKIHACGLILGDIKYGNVIIEKKSGKPYLVDFDSAVYYSNLGQESYRILRDRDIERFNLHFNTIKLTYGTVRKTIRNRHMPSPNDWYAPVYFGAGLRIGSLWDVGVGYGRWHYILRDNLPSVSRKRILDLGANNAAIAIEMLRHGAREVVGVESETKYIEQGNWVKEVFQWADNRQYDLTYIRADMADIPDMNLGRFDMVLGLCSIYYLGDDAMINLVQYLSSIADILVLQCNTATNLGRRDPQVYERASVEYTLRLLRDNGFPSTRVIAPYRYTRPLVVGRKGGRTS